MSNWFRRHLLTCVAVVAATVTTMGLIGCNDKDESAPSPQQPASPPARQTTPPQSPVSGGAAQPSDDARDAAPPAGDTSSTEKEKRDAVSTPTETVPPATPQPQAPAPQSQPPTPRAQPQQQQQPPPAATANTPQAKARVLLDQLMAQIAQNQWKEGEKTLQELNKLKASVPQEMREEIDNAKASFNAAKQISNQDR